VGGVEAASGGGVCSQAQTSAIGNALVASAVSCSGAEASPGKPAGLTVDAFGVPA